MKEIKTPYVKIKDINTGKYYDIPAIRGESAYELAVKGGYTGSLEEFEEEIGRAAIYSQEAKQSSDKAKESEINSKASEDESKRILEEVEQSVVEITESVNRASQYAQSANSASQSATQSANSASQSATQSANSKEQAQAASEAAKSSADISKTNADKAISAESSVASNTQIVNESLTEVRQINNDVQAMKTSVETSERQASSYANTAKGYSESAETNSAKAIESANKAIESAESAEQDASLAFEYSEDAKVSKEESKNIYDNVQELAGNLTQLESEYNLPDHEVIVKGVVQKGGTSDINYLFRDTHNYAKDFSFISFSDDKTSPIYTYTAVLPKGKYSLMFNVAGIENGCKIHVIHYPAETTPNYVDIVQNGFAKIDFEVLEDTTLSKPYLFYFQIHVLDSAQYTVNISEWGLRDVNYLSLLDGKEIDDEFLVKWENSTGGISLKPLDVGTYPDDCKVIRLGYFTNASYPFSYENILITILSTDKFGEKYALQWKLNVTTTGCNTVFCRGNILPPDFDDSNKAFGIGIGAEINSVGKYGICPISIIGFEPYFKNRLWKASKTDEPLLDESFYANAKVYIDVEQDNFIKAEEILDYVPSETGLNTGPSSHRPWYGFWDGSDYSVFEKLNLIDKDNKILVEDIKNLAHADDLESKQNKLIAGKNIVIDGDVISSEVEQMYKFPNATIIGEPTINNGQISDFSNDNYLKFPFLVDFKNRPFSINMDFTTGSNVVSQENIFDSDFGLAFAIRDSKLVIAISSNGTNWNLGEGVGTYTVLPNTTYRVKLAWDGSQYTLAYSLDGGNTYITDITKVSSEQPYPKQIYIGVGQSDITVLNFFSGIINFNHAELYISDTLVWQGMDDVGLASRLATDLSNIDADGVSKVKDIIEKELTQAEYNALSEEEKKNGTVYYVPDADNIPPVSSITTHQSSVVPTIYYTIVGDMMLVCGEFQGNNTSLVDLGLPNAEGVAPVTVRIGDNGTLLTRYCAGSNMSGWDGSRDNIFSSSYTYQVSFVTRLKRN